MDKKHKGSRAELLACAWLLDQGYEVFRNVSDSSIVDLVAFKDAEFFPFDVKSVKTTKLSSKQIAVGVKPLYVSNRERHIDWHPKPSLRGSRKICSHCGRSMAPPYWFDEKGNAYCCQGCKDGRELPVSRTTSPGDPRPIRPRSKPGPKRRGH